MSDDATKEKTAMPNRSAALLSVLALVGCTPQQIATGTRYADEIAGVCQQAVAILPMFPQLEPWLADCRTAAGIAKLALDSSSLEWLIGILGRL